MSTQRMIAAAFFSAVIVVVLTAIIYTDRVASTNTATVYILQHDVPAGQIVAQGDFSQQSVHADEAEFSTAENRTIDQLAGQTRYLVTMHAHDILRRDDTTDAQKNAEVPILLRGDASPGFAAGDRIDVYAFFNGQTVRVSGPAGVAIVSVGPPMVISVPSADEPYWVTLAFSKPEMIGTRAGGALSAVPPANNSEAIALCSLSGNTQICTAAGTPNGGNPTGQ